MSRSAIETSRRYHARRDEERFRSREALRQQVLDEVRRTVRELAPGFSEVQAVYAFGSLLRPGRFSARSDVDLAIDCADLEQESRFHRALEDELGRQVDLRPRKGPVADAVELGGEAIYEREVPAPRTES
jgi:predicted nucleotidyltransferase